MINEHIRAHINQETDLNETKLKEIHQTVKMDQILGNDIHSKLFNTEDNTVAVKESSTWLLHGYLTPQDEGSLCKIQDRNVFFKNARCGHCHLSNQIVDHLATNCGKLLEHEYKRRHDEIVKAIHHHICHQYGIARKTRKNYVMPPTIANERIRIKFVKPVVTDSRLEHNRPDLIIHDLRRKVLTIFEI